MKKLKLDLDELAVETFDPAASEPGEGTVLGEQVGNTLMLSCGRGPCVTLAATCITCMTCGVTCLTCFVSCGPVTCQATCGPTCVTCIQYTCGYTCLGCPTRPPYCH